jgi:tetratricopeptide (TPR) repeat protein
MIVKNESEAIGQCLNSLKHLINYWVIVDTGSTDGTQEIITTLLKEVPGELHERPWVDFAHNRNEALALAKDKGDYLLFIDADEALECSKSFAFPSLDKDFYHIRLREKDGTEIQRTALINSQHHWKWKGVLHETLECPEAKSSALLEDVIILYNIGRGARSKDPQKFLNDAQTLEKALEQEPNHTRYLFYLAQSYLHAGKNDLAEKAYQKRIAMESEDVQETYSALYTLGLLQGKTDPEAAIEAYFKAYRFRPSRAEPLFQIAALYRRLGLPLLGYRAAKFALTLPRPLRDICVEHTTYDHQLKTEYTFCAFASGKYQEGIAASEELLTNPTLPADLKLRIQANREGAKQIRQIVTPSEEETETDLKDFPSLTAALEKDLHEASELLSLAQTCFHEKRQDDPSTYATLYRLAALQSKSHPRTAIQTYIKAYLCCPLKTDPLSSAILLYREAGLPLLGYRLAKFALTLPSSANNDHLQAEYAFCAFFSERYPEAIDISEKLLAKPNFPEALRSRITTYLKIAKQNISRK